MRRIRSKVGKGRAWWNERSVSELSTQKTGEVASTVMREGDDVVSVRPLVVFPCGMSGSTLR